MESPLIREANKKDIANLCTLWRKMMLFHENLDERFRFTKNAAREYSRHIANALHARNMRVFVAEMNGEIIGYIFGEVQERSPIFPVGRFGFVSDIYVTEEWRRKGVGRRLFYKMREWMLKESITAIELLAAERNPHSVAFWESLGFVSYLRLLRKEENC